MEEYSVLIPPLKLIDPRFLVPIMLFLLVSLHKLLLKTQYFRYILVAPVLFHGSKLFTSMYDSSIRIYAIVALPRNKFVPTLLKSLKMLVHWRSLNALRPCGGNYISYFSKIAPPFLKLKGFDSSKRSL